ncbi:MAG: crotonobetainyl-CoA:carnitine CoA-transferase CaiB-like acyl-CoA transferase [Gammaproteobacteria bacterium]|jgi:crotonobetainyl-CoA:carnitine CoA-transferase CaiB-like acyl-CoA transferase
MSGPLSGVRIIDLSNVVSGPMAVQILADQGADVIKVEQPGSGDTARGMGAVRAGMGALFAVLNRNKRSVVIDMQKNEGREIMRDLVISADVIVQNFRPGAMQRMGLDYPALKAINDKLIYASISGFGQDGPYSNRRVYDPVIQSVAGFVDCQTSKKETSPQLIKNIICDKATALSAAQAITAALYARERGHGGQFLEVAMIDVGLSFLWPDGMWNNTYIGDDVRPMPSLSEIYRVQETADGYIVSIIVSDAEWQSMCRAIGNERLASDPRFDTLPNRIKNIDELTKLVDAEVATWQTEELCAKLDAEDVPFAKINRLDEVHLDPQIVHRGTIVEMEHPTVGRMRLPRPTAQFSATPSAIRFLAPTFGQHTNEVLAELGRSEATIASLRDIGAIA